MKIPKDRLASLAQAQPNLPQSLKDKVVLEAARHQAAMRRQKQVPNVSARQSLFFGWFSKPMWIGSGSVLASLLVMFLVTGNPVPEETSLPIASPVSDTAAVAAPPAPVPIVEPINETPLKEPSLKSAAKPSIIKPKIQESAPLKKAPEALEVTAVPPTPAPAPAPAPSARVAAVISAAPQGVAKEISRKREAMPESVDACTQTLLSIPDHQRTASNFSVKQLVQHCMRQFPKTEWPDNLSWIKQINVMEPSNVEPEPSK